MNPTDDLVTSLLAGASNAVPNEPKDEELPEDPEEASEEEEVEEEEEAEENPELEEPAGPPTVDDLKQQILDELKAEERAEAEPDEQLPQLEMPAVSKYTLQQLLGSIQVDRDRLASDPTYILDLFVEMHNNALALDSSRQLEAMHRVARHTTNEERRQVDAGQKFWKDNAYLLEDLEEGSEAWQKRVSQVQRIAAGVQAENPGKSLAWIYRETGKDLAEIFQPQEKKRKQTKRQQDAQRALPKPGSSPRPKPGPKPGRQAMLADQVLSGGKAKPR